MIRLTGIERVFRVGDEEVHALRGVSLDIAQGEYLSIMGPSGSGKSTLLNILGLLDRPNAGRYELNGRDVTGLADDELARARREAIGFVFQFFHLVPRLTAEQNIELPMVLAGIDPAERRRRLDKLLADYGLEPRAGHRPDQLSGGQCQRVAIARAMATRAARSPSSPTTRRSARAPTAASGWSTARFQATKGPLLEKRQPLQTQRAQRRKGRKAFCR